MKTLTLSITLMLLLHPATRGQHATADSIGNLFLEQISSYPQEKIYVHTDRSVYMAGEILHFRAYLVDAVLLRQANASRYVYVELINELSKIVKRVKIRPDSTGCFYGRILLPEDVAEAHYSLRAYTWYMRNLGEDYFFSKDIYITHPASGIQNTPGEQKQPPVSDTFHVSFFPEGGQAPLQADVKMAFKAIGTDGLSEEIRGQIFDDEGRLCADFQSYHLGMGSFRMHYIPGRKYHALCTNTNNKTKRFDLPPARENAVSLQVIKTRNLFRIMLSKTPGYPIAADLQLIAHIRGVVLYAQPWNKEQPYLDFEKEFFPAGIVHFLLTDADRNIVSERLVFSDQPGTIAQTDILSGSSTYRPRQKVELAISVKDSDGTPLKGNFSIAVTDDNDIKPDSVSNIVSTLLLTSELKGHIESPMSYLHTNNTRASYALDLLMLTQGWRRYNIPQLLKGTITRNLSYPVELGDEVTGKIEGIFSALKKGSISLMAVNDSVIGTFFTEPDQQGNFAFKGLEYPEGTWYFIQALTQKGSKRVFIELAPRKTFPIPTKPILAPGIKPVIEETYVAKMNEKYTLENGMRVYNLDEVVVTAKKITKLKTESPFYSSNSSKILTAEDVERWNPLSTYDLLRRIPGVLVRNGNDVYFRNERPMALIDNIPYDVDFNYDQITVEDINDIFVSPSTSVAAIYGSRAAGGAVVINTKKGFVQKNKMNTNMKIVSPVGYQPYVEFYSPRYETQAEKNSEKPDLRTTIYWNPAMQTDETGTATVHFYTADPVTRYSVVVQGVSASGHLIYSDKKKLEMDLQSH